MINCVIIDDEPLAREGLSIYVKEIDFLQLTGVCENPVEFITLLDKFEVDLIFLDIQMPKMNGIDFLKITPKPPMVIITTAYPSYALESFQLNVLDYLLKPITFDRFFQATNKVKDYFQLLHKAQENDTNAQAANYFFVKCDNKFEKIFFEDILYIQSMQNYVNIHTLKGKYITLLTLKNIEENLNKRQFIRVHKSYIIAISKIESIESHQIVIQSFPIPLSRNYREEVIQQVVNDKLWKNK
jgi:two-component system, LytTR family, response regulator